MSDIVLIAPFENILKMAKQVVDENGFDVDVVLGDLSQGVEVAREYLGRGAKVFISRGGTYMAINNAIKAPVVEIKLNSFDILKIFKRLINCKGRIGVAGYKNVIYGCETVGDVLNLDITKIEIETENRAYEQIMSAARNGVTTIVGDSISCKCAKKIGLKSYMITSGKDAIIDAINEAIRIRAASKNEIARAMELKTIIDFAHDGIMAIDHEERITSFNSSAGKILGLDPADVIGKCVRECIPDSGMERVLNNGVTEIRELENINNCKIVTNRVPIKVENSIVGVVATFQSVMQIQKAEHKIRREMKNKGFIARYRFEDIIYKSDKMRECIDVAKKYSSIDSPVLILGKSGVGKEMFAQSIHNNSKRKNEAFVAVNCSALPSNLLESELFGYAEGAFTGAKKGGKMGLFEMAHKGTIFLDEIGDLPADFQSKLLRVLQENEIQRIGDDRVIPIDVRVISATNKDIENMVNGNLFREDLFYRINTLPIEIPSLNERREDIEVLVSYFIKHYSKKYSKSISSIDRKAIEYLREYNYKGNVRELEGIIERGVVLCDSGVLTINEIKVFGIRKNTNQVMSLKEMEDKYIDSIIKNCGGNLTEAAKILNVNRSTLYRRTNLV